MMGPSEESSEITVVIVLLLASITTNVSYGITICRQKKQYNFVVYSMALSVFRSGLQTGTGIVESPNPVPHQFFHSAGASIEVASKQLEVLNEVLTEQGIPHVVDISLRLANIANDFVDSEQVSKQQLDGDVKFLTQTQPIIETRCFEEGTSYGISPL
jgi:hypothetical protein